MTTATTFKKHLEELRAIRAFAERHPELADTLAPYITADEKALDLTELTIEDIAREAVGSLDVTWGWQDDYESGDEDATWLEHAGMRLSVSASDDNATFYLNYQQEDRWYDESTARTKEQLFNRVASWARNAKEFGEL